MKYLENLKMELNNYTFTGIYRDNKIKFITIFPKTYDPKGCKSIDPLNSVFIFEKCGLIFEKIEFIDTFSNKFSLE
jgi:hypothetical protein